MRFIFLFLLIILPFSLPAAGTPEGTPPLTLLFFGDSLTAGYGLDDPDNAYPNRIRKKLEAAGIPAVVIPAGLSGETTAGGTRRINWVLRPPRGWPKDQPFQLDVFFLCLGGNDGLRGIDLADTKQNLLRIIESVRGRYPDVKVVLAGMDMPVNWGQPYRDGFRNLFRDVAENHADAFLPFLLEGVGGNPDLMQNDQIHPNAQGHQKMAELVWETLQKVIPHNGVNVHISYHSSPICCFLGRPVDLKN